MPYPDKKLLKLREKRYLRREFSLFLFLHCNLFGQVTWFYSFPLVYFRYFEVSGKVLKVKTKLSQRVGVQYYIEVKGINDRLSTRPVAVWKYNITTCVKNVHAPYFKQVYIVYNIIYKLRALMIGWVLNHWLYGSIISVHVSRMSMHHTSSRLVQLSIHPIDDTRGTGCRNQDMGFRWRRRFTAHTSIV